MTLSEKIIEIAEERNATFSELARTAGLDPTIISRMVNCKRVGNKTISKLVKAFGEDFEQFYQYATCCKCGEKFLPRNSKVKVCSAKCLKENAIETRVSWKKYPGPSSAARETDAKRFGWGAKVKGPAVSIAEYNSVARKEYGSYGQRGATERLAQSGTMRESMGQG
jgi:hypothetical protein